MRLMSRSFLGCLGEEMFKSRWSDIDEHPDWLIRIIFETVNRADRRDLLIGGVERSVGRGDQQAKD